MAALAAAVGPFAGSVPRRAATVPCDASERAPGEKPRRVAPARDSPAVCLAGVEESCVPSQKRKMTCNRSRNSVKAAADTKVLTVGGEMSARELLQKRLACELDALRGLLKKAELVSRRRACKGCAPPTAAGKEERLLVPKQPGPKPIEDGGGNAPSVKRRKISTLVEQKQKQIRAPRMSTEERSQLAGRLCSLSEELPEHIAEFLQKQFGDADAHGEIEIDIDSVEDSLLFELKTKLDKFSQERRIVVDVLPEEKDEKLAEESKSKGILVEQEEVKTGSRPSSRSSRVSDTDGEAGRPAPHEILPEEIIATAAQPPSEPAQMVQQSAEAKKVQDAQRAAPKAVYMPGLIYRANLRRQLLEMERAVLPDQSIHPRDLQRLGIAEYGNPSIMRQLGLVLKADA